MLNFKRLIMDDLITILYVVSPIVFFVSLYYLVFRIFDRKDYRILQSVFVTNFLLLIYLIFRSYKEPYISIYYGILGIIGFTFALRGIYKYFSEKEFTEQQKIKVAIYIFICLIIGFGMCSTTGIFGF